LDTNVSEENTAFMFRAEVLTTHKINMKYQNSACKASEVSRLAVVVSMSRYRTVMSGLEGVFLDFIAFVYTSVLGV
jgi:hypothetical protein